VSGRHIVAAALDDANDEKHHGEAYTVHLWLRSGREVHGAVERGMMRPFNGGLLLELELWKQPFYNGHPRGGEPPVPTGHRVLIDPDEVEQIEVCW
jgi:hypothetical protein